MNPAFEKARLECIKLEDATASMSAEQIEQTRPQRIAARDEMLRLLDGDEPGENPTQTAPATPAPTLSYSEQFRAITDSRERSRFWAANRDKILTSK